MFGMSAKDRLAMFENKSGGDTKKGAPPKKKIGKLNVPGPKETKTNEVPKKASDLKKVPKKVKPKEEPKKVEEVKDVKKEPVNDVKAADKPKEAKKEPEKQVPEEKQPAKDVASKPVEKPAAGVKDKVKEDPKVSEPKEKPVENKDQNPKAVEPENKPKAAEKPKEQPKPAPKEDKPKVEEKPKPEEKEKPKVEVSAAKKAEVPAKKEEAPAKKEEPKKEQVPKEETKAVEKVKQQKETKPTEKPKEEPKPKTKDEKPKVEDKLKPKPTVQPKGDQEAKKPAQKATEEVKDKVNPQSAKVEAKPAEKKETEEKAEKVQPEVQDVPDAPQKPKVRPFEARMPLYKALPEEFYDTLFYFSGMGTVVGSALNQGVFVPQRAKKSALETNVIEDIEAEKDKERQHETYLIRTARKQAFDLAEELRKLQGLLGGMPSFGQDKSELNKIDMKPVDSVMHARYHTYQIPHQPQKPRTPPPKAEKPWPPPVQQQMRPQKPVVAEPEGQWPPPFQMPASQVMPVKENIVPVDTPVGVFKGAKPEDKGKASAWQDKYGTHGVANTKAPEPFNTGGSIPKGLKPWELSRLRGLEVKGYQFTHDQPDSGADHSDTFYHGHASVETEEMKEDIPSLAPFLVSKKSQRIDRQHILTTTQDPNDQHFLTMKEYYGLESDSVPYHDF